MSILVGLEELHEALLDEYKLAPNLFREVANVETLLADTYRDRFLYELLQNSDDAEAVSVSVSVVDGVLTWTNDGRALSLTDVEAMCRSAVSNKVRGDSIGYKGIGFKSLASVASSIRVESSSIAFEFDRTQTKRVLQERFPQIVVGDVPLIRVPTALREGTIDRGVSFQVVPDNGAQLSPRDLNPLSLVFLRHIRSLRIEDARGDSQYEVRRDGGMLHLRVSRKDEATFVVREREGASVAIPLNASAVSLTGTAGRMACFLPLDDRLGLPVLVSGSILTDPSRTHAVTSDPSTIDVLQAAASLITDVLCDPADPAFDRMWELCLLAEDPRSHTVEGRSTVAAILWSAISDECKQREFPFGFHSVSFTEDEAKKLFHGTAPVALYDKKYKTQARSLRVMLGIGRADLTTAVSPKIAPTLSEDTRGQITGYLKEVTNAEARDLTTAEAKLSKVLVPTEATDPVQDRRDRSVSVVKAVGEQETSFGSHMKRWRVAEVSVMNWLNEQGWDVRDVSKQNVGYDLEGRDADGERAYVEVKKVTRLDDRFSLTTNEMSVLQSTSSGFFLAIVVGDGPTTQLLIADAADGDLTFDRVCRQWTWECSEWSPHFKRLA